MRLIELINERAEIEKLLRDMTRRPGAFWSSTPKGMSGYLAKAHDQTRKMMHAEARADRAAALKTIRSQSEEAPEFASGLRRLLDRHIHLSRMIQDAYASIRLDDGMPLQEALCRQAALRSCATPLSRAGASCCPRPTYFTTTGLPSRRNDSAVSPIPGTKSTGCCRCGSIAHYMVRRLTDEYPFLKSSIT